MTRYYIAKDAKGAIVATRETASRTYTHAVVVRCAGRLSLANDQWASRLDLAQAVARRWQRPGSVFEPEICPAVEVDRKAYVAARDYLQP